MSWNPTSVVATATADCGDLSPLLRDANLSARLGGVGEATSRFVEGGDESPQSKGREAPEGRSAASGTVECGDLSPLFRGADLSARLGEWAKRQVASSKALSRAAEYPGYGTS